MDRLLTGYEELVKAHNDGLEYEKRELKKAGKTRKEIEQLIEKFGDCDGNIDKIFFTKSLKTK